MASSRFLAHSFFLALLCGCQKPSANLEAIYLQEVRLPGGEKIMTELMTRTDDMARGMMHRPQLPADRGLLFAFAKPGVNRFWMFNVKVPLDIVWMDRNRTIIEIVRNTQPCPELPCPRYGGDKIESQFILELAAGMAAKYGLQVGQSVTF